MGHIKFVSSRRLTRPVSLNMPPPPHWPGQAGLSATLNIPFSPLSSSGPGILPVLLSAAEVCPRIQPQLPGQARRGCCLCCCELD